MLFTFLLTWNKRSFWTIFETSNILSHFVRFLDVIHLLYILKLVNTSNF